MSYQKYICLFLLYITTTLLAAEEQPASNPRTYTIGIWHIGNLPYINLSLGSQGTTLRFLFDTGSTSLVVKDINCPSCKLSEFSSHYFFNSPQSVSLTKIKNSFKGCDQSSLCPNYCSKIFKYLDETTLITCWVSDKVSLIPIDSANDIQTTPFKPILNYFNFFIIKDQQGDINMDGILGVQDIGTSLDELEKIPEDEIRSYVASKDTFGFIEYAIASNKLEKRSMLVDIPNSEVVFGFVPEAGYGDREANSKLNRTLRRNINNSTCSSSNNNSHSSKERVNLEQNTESNEEGKLLKEQNFYSIGEIKSKPISHSFDPRDYWKSNTSYSSKFWLSPAEFYSYKIVVNRTLIDNKEVSVTTYDAFLDTGSTNVYLPPELYDAIVQRILELQPEFSIFVQNQSYCFRNPAVELLVKKLPKIFFLLEKGTQVKLAVELLAKTKFKESEEDIYCCTIAKLQHKMIILGFPFFNKRQVLFDYEKKNISVVGVDDELNTVGSIFQKIADLINFLTLII